MKLLVDLRDLSVPKRGDILQTNVGDRRERTTMILRAHRSKRTPGRFHIWTERWWELEPEFRIRLYRSAERNGGQATIYFERYRASRRKPWHREL